MLQPQPRASEALEGEFPAGAALLPAQGTAPSRGPFQPCHSTLGNCPPRSHAGSFTPNALSPLIQMAFKKRRCFSALITSAESSYCLVSCCCLNTASHGEGTGQACPRSLPCPRLGQRLFACAGGCPSEHSPATPAHGTARRWGR